MILSVLTAMHLALDHNLGVIAEWLSDNGWLIVSFTKLTTFLIFIKFLELKSDLFKKLKTILRNAMIQPRREFLVCLILLISWPIFLNQVTYQQEFLMGLSDFVQILVGNIVFYGIDILFVLSLDSLYPLNGQRDLKYKHLVFPLIFYAANRITFMFEMNIQIALIPIFAIMLFLGYYRRRNWTLPLYFILMVVLSYSIIYGVDLVFESRHSLFKIKTSSYAFGMWVSAAVMILYLEWKKYKNPEYIFLD